ncbi:MAG: HAMP domain-containing histidine kinase [Alphaproteobacteria bacterium]|nr:HAMP domain-containing histidine kinase [Alphaproteobacteria bacterium]
MHRYIRTFALVGGIHMLAAAVLLSTYLRRAETQSAMALAEGHNVALARSLGNAMRERVRELMSDPDRRPGHQPPVADFHRDVVRQLHGLDIVKVKIYDLRGRTAFSTEAKQIGEDKAGNLGYQLARAGEVASELTFRNKFSAFEGVIEDRNVLSSYIPLRGTDGAIESVFEIYQDVTPLLESLSHWQWAQSSAIFGAFGVVYLLLLMIMRRAENVARQRHDEAVALAADAARAESANRTKTEFLATMSHELRTPLNAILGFSDMIHSEVLGPNGNPRYREYAGDIHASANHLLDIINDILDMARIEAGRTEITLSTVSLPHFAEWAQTMVRTQAEAGKVTLRTRLDPALAEFVTDERMLRQIALNLLTNAIKFTPAGGTVTLSLSGAVADHLSVTVEDTGVGMRPEDIPRALAPFSQLDNSLSRKHRGTGLGLSLANRFVGLLGGQLAINSAPGRGTRVTVTLAVRTDALAAAA